VRVPHGLGSGQQPELASAAVLAILEISTGYRILGLLHIIAVVVAFGPLFVYPALRRAGAASEMAKLHTYVSLPALVLVWVLGMGMIGMSDNAIEVSDTWVLLALLSWVVLMVVSWFLIRPAINDTGEQAAKRLAMGTGITHLLLVFSLWLMVFKPFLERG